MYYTLLPLSSKKKMTCTVLVSEPDPRISIFRGSGSETSTVQRSSSQVVKSGNVISLVWTSKLAVSTALFIYGLGTMLFAGQHVHVWSMVWEHAWSIRTGILEKAVTSLQMSSTNMVQYVWSENQI